MEKRAKLFQTLENILQTNCYYSLVPKEVALTVRMRTMKAFEQGGLKKETSHKETQRKKEVMDPLTPLHGQRVTEPTMSTPGPNAARRKPKKLSIRTSAVATH